jgi:hypothetical protein
MMGFSFLRQSGEYYFSMLKKSSFSAKFWGKIEVLG